MVLFRHLPVQDLGSGEQPVHALQLCRCSAGAGGGDPPRGAGTDRAHRPGLRRGQGFGTDTGAAAPFVFASLQGTISTWNAGTTAVTQFTATDHAIYTGLTVAGANLYAADARERQRLTSSTTPSTRYPCQVRSRIPRPAGFAPYIQNINASCTSPISCVAAGRRRRGVRPERQSPAAHQRPPPELTMGRRDRPDGAPSPGTAEGPRFQMVTALSRDCFVTDGSQVRGWDGRRGSGEAIGRDAFK